MKTYRLIEPRPGGLTEISEATYSSLTPSARTLYVEVSEDVQTESQTEPVTEQEEQPTTTTEEPKEEQTKPKKQYVKPSSNQ